VGAALARMVGVVGRQLDFLRLPNYLDPATFARRQPQPHTQQLFERVASALAPGADLPAPASEPALESQDFGWATGLEKAAEADEARARIGVDAKPPALLKHPLYSYPGGHSFFDLYVDVVEGSTGSAARARAASRACTRTAPPCARS
jgi:6-phosphofructokinase 1